MKKLLLAIALLCSAGAAKASAMPASDSRALEHHIAETAAEIGVAQGAIEISVAATAPVKFQIYSITGQMVKAIVVDNGETARIELPQGYYIVKCDQWSKRVLVK